MTVVSEQELRVRAEARYVRTSARKARLVVDEIRGLSVPQARTLLTFMPKAAARDVAQVLASAAANAEANHGLVSDEMLVAEAYVGEGPTLKRWKARARGRVGRIHKRTCHITILLRVDADRPAAAPQAAEPAGTRRRRGAAPESPDVSQTVAADTPKPSRRRASAGDDLKLIEGIGPKIAGILSEAGIVTFADLAARTPDEIREILAASGARVGAADPTTWPEQAALAAAGDTAGLEALQAGLAGGRRSAPEAGDAAAEAVSEAAAESTEETDDAYAGDEQSAGEGEEAK